MGWDEVKKLHNRFTKYPLDLLYYIADYKMHGNESYAYNVENIRDMIYDNVDISMFDDDLIADTFIHHLVKGSIGKAIAARCDLQDKNIYTNMNTREEIVHTPLVTNPPEWFKKILIDDYFIRNCLDINGIGHITSYILAKCGISADYIFKVVNGSSNNITNSMTYTFNVYENMFSTRDWDGGIFNLNTQGLIINSSGVMDPYKLAQRIEIARPSIIHINGFYIDPSIDDYHLTIVTPTSQYDIFNRSDIPSIYNTSLIRDNLIKKIRSFTGMNAINGRPGYVVACSLYIIGDAGTSLIGGNGIKIIGRLYEYRDI